MGKPLFIGNLLKKWLILLLTLPFIACSSQTQPNSPSEPEALSDPESQPEASIVSNFYGSAPE